MTEPRPFLTARWRHLAMLNYEAPPALLAPLVPAGTELDLLEGRPLASMVGFLFLDTRVRGWAVPFHRDFEEVNLRFYVRRRAPDGWHRGVVFVKEVVRRAAITWLARTRYQENYVTLPMSHRVSADDPPSVRYAWGRRGSEMAIELDPAGPHAPLAPGSEAEFIAEHYWGYTALRDGGALEYRVDHPSWRAAPARRAALLGDARPHYGAAFAEILARPPRSAFLAEGSEVAVYPGVRTS